MEPAKPTKEVKKLASDSDSSDSNKDDSDSSTDISDDEVSICILYNVIKIIWFYVNLDVECLDIFIFWSICLTVGSYGSGFFNYDLTLTILL